MGSPNDLFISKGPQTGVPMSWGGLPYRGPVRDYREADPDRMQPQLQFEPHVR